MSNKGQMMTHDKIPDILKGIILSSNRFDGEIPTSIANLKGLQVISLASNNLQGHIPSCLGSLTNLESLDLSKNSSSNGKSRLCGKPLPKESENSEPPANEAHIEGSKALFSGASEWKIVLTGYTVTPLRLLYDLHLLELLKSRAVWTKAFHTIPSSHQMNYGQM
ncbi:hypothetical protein WN944_005811 [Citrus x changshan-huyou]|uniref:Uncharacterized protein n=1 Tax=Citrus x changshan-huyou TaxID=2935761 RepID=A0AAP0QSK2_9ROSI